MAPVLLSFAAFLSTMAGGIVGLKNKDRLHRFLGFAAGVLIGVVAFDLLPEIFDLLKANNQEPIWVMVALVAGFLGFHIVEKSILIHHANEDEYEKHRHPHVGIASALALIGHSFLDGIAIGLGFQVSPSVGIVVAIAVLAHDFTDGLNTVNLMLLNNNKSRRSLMFLIADALAPVLGVIATIFFTVSDGALVIYLGFFSGFLLYIGASEILPEAHSKNSSYWTIVTTILGAAFIFAVTRLS